MEINQIEVAAVEQADKENNQDQVKELSELQLALAGGGIGSVIFA